MSGIQQALEVRSLERIIQLLVKATRLLSFYSSVFSKVICLTLFLISAACGPGVKDGSRHISHGYNFFYVGGDENFVEYKDNN